jgi:beta-galactosidase
MKTATKLSFLKAGLCILVLCFSVISVSAQNKRTNFNHNWQFYKFKSNEIAPYKTALYDTSKKGFDSQFTNDNIKQDVSKQAAEILQKEGQEAKANFHNEYDLIPQSAWQEVSLPHTANVEPLITGPDMWQGVAYYKKQFVIDKKYSGQKISIEFEGAMQQSDVWLNGKLVTQHKGGYTPFYVDCTNGVFYNKTNVIIVRIDSHALPTFPPGKPLLKNGYNYWSGLYRNAWLTITNPVHITNAVQAQKEMGGGVFFRTPDVTKESATALLKTNVINESKTDEHIVVKQILKSPLGKIETVNLSPVKLITRGKDIDVEQQFKVENPLLWSTDTPNLYTLNTVVLVNGVEMDNFSQRVGFRKLSFSRKDGFKLNGEPLKLIGVNRHQDYPYIGVALSDDAQYRDLKKIKEAGFNTIRLSHYPQAASVYEAADELGLMLLDGIPGWQFFNDNDIFKERVYRDIRDMIYRDRNHPSIILWEANLNESYPADTFRVACHQLVHRELPAGEYFTIGETYGAKHTTWDVAMANWHDDKDTIFRNNYERAQDVQPNSPGFIKEYADWEYGGVQSTTRSTRADGEKAMLRGLWNTLWEHNTDLDYEGNTGDAIWAMYDNNIPSETRNYEWGVSDYFRLPKFVAPLFTSQLQPFKKVAGVDNSKPYLFVANWWTPRQGKDKVIVLSNCDKIILKVNGKIVGEQTPDNGPTTAYGLFDKGGANPFDGGNCHNYLHPPFTFKDILYEPGTLTAEGYIKGEKVAEQVVCTPEQPVQIKLAADYSERQMKADKADAIFVYASLVDKNGTVACLDNTTEVEFSVAEGGAKIVGPSKVKVRGGIASILLQSTTLKPGKIVLVAKANKNKGDTLEITTRD